MDTIKYTQNFLHSPKLVQNIVDKAHIQADDTVLEIGSGKGIITSELAQRVKAGRVVAVELDNELFIALKEQFQSAENVHVVSGNILEFDFAQLGADYKVFSNIPFNITSEILETLFTGAECPAQAHLILQTNTLVSQTEFGDGETFKSLMLKPTYEITNVHDFKRSDFAPPPAVDTALFAFTRLKNPLIKIERYENYKDFLACIAQDRVGEGAWRKIFSKKQLQILSNTSSLIFGKGLKSQSVQAIVSAYEVFYQDKSKHRITNGAMNQLREKQSKMDAKNQQGGHHRSRKRRR